MTHNTCLASWIGLPSAKPSRKITEVHDLFRFVAFLKVTLEWLSSVHTAPRAFSLGSQRIYLWTNVALACNASAKEGPLKTRSVNGMQALKRRSSRMALKARITMSGDDCTKCAFTLPAKATKLNRHGAAIQLNRELLIGSTVVLQNTRHIQLSARVVTQVSAQRQGVYTYGVEFLEAEAAEKNFWGISFPPPAR